MLMEERPHVLCRKEFLLPPQTSASPASRGLGNAFFLVRPGTELKAGFFSPFPPHSHLCHNHKVYRSSPSRLPAT
ncbi:mCG1028018 [Mus musculus]|nr:mCG1028018 [Mus musculus]